MNWNPKSWFKSKPADGAVYVAVVLDKPLQGITLHAPATGVWIKVKGISLETAAQVIPGRSINWHTVPMSIRSQLEIDFKGLEMEWTDFKGWVI